MGNKTLAVRFDGGQVTVTDKRTGRVRKTLQVPTLHKVNYDTTTGKNMIVFTGKGTSPYNIREHGGDITLKAWFGVEKHIAVNCTGLVTEGRYPETSSSSN